MFSNCFLKVNSRQSLLPPHPPPTTTTHTLRHFNFFILQVKKKRNPKKLDPASQGAVSLNDLPCSKSNGVVYIFRAKLASYSSILYEYKFSKISSMYVSCLHLFIGSFILFYTTETWQTKAGSAFFRKKKAQCDRLKWSCI